MRAYEAVRAIRGTARLVTTSVVLAVDRDDPELPAYQELRWGPWFRAETSVVVLEPHETGNLVRATNTVAMRVAAADPDAIIGNLGDDHVCRTPGWDVLVEASLMSPGLAYGRDGIQDEKLPTAPFMSARIALALGYYALPDCEHMFIDNAWRDIAEQAGVRRYLPDMFIEHMHPAVAKAHWDAGYLRTNSDEAIRRDKLRYESWREHAMAIDIARVRDALAAAA